MWPVFDTQLWKLGSFPWNAFFFLRKGKSSYCQLWRCLQLWELSYGRLMLLGLFFMCQWVCIFFFFLQVVFACLKTSASKVGCLAHLHCSSWLLFMVKIRTEGRSLTMCAFMSWRYKPSKRNGKNLRRSQKYHNLRSRASCICWSPDLWCLVFLILNLATHMLQPERPLWVLEPSGVLMCGLHYFWKWEMMPFS